jgi:hypothetical protein
LPSPDGPELPGQVDSVGAIGGLTDDLDMVAGVKQRLESSPDQALVIRDQDSDHGEDLTGRRALSCDTNSDVKAMIIWLLATSLFGDVAAALCEHVSATLDEHLAVTLAALAESRVGCPATCAVAASRTAR